MYTIDIETTDRPAETHYFDDAAITIGCDGGDIMLADDKLGEPHAELRFDGRRVTYVDLATSTGSFDRSGRQLAGPTILSEGDSIRLGRCKLTLRAVEPTSQMTIPDGAAPTDDLNTTVEDMPSIPLASQTAAASDYPDAADTRVDPVAPATVPDAATIPLADGPGPAAPPPVVTAPPDDDLPSIPLAEPTTASGTIPATPPNPGPASAAGAGPDPADSANGADSADSADSADAEPESWSQRAPGAAQAAGQAVRDHLGRASSKIEGSVHRAADTVQRGVDRATHEFEQRAPKGDRYGVADAIQRGLALIQPNAVQAFLIIGALLLTPAVLNLLLGWLPGLGPALVGVVRIAAALAYPLAIAALCYYMLAAHLGRPVSAQNAWQAVWKQPLAVWLSFAVAGALAAFGAVFLIIPGIALGLFLGPVFFIEQRRLLQVNLRCLDYFREDVTRLITLTVVAWLLPSLLIAALAWVCNLVIGILPWIGDHLGASLAELVSAAGQTVLITLMAAVATQLFFEIRARRDGDAGEEDARGELAVFTHRTPAGGNSANS